MDLHVLDELVGSTDVLQASKTDLCNDGTELS